jgi:hypothetical protein
MIMSTLALWSAGAAAPAIERKKSKPSLFQRFAKAREAEAARRIYSFLAIQGDARLKDLGYTAEDIETLRQGRFPAH